MSVGRDEGRLRCPGGKRELLMAAMAELRGELTRHARVPWWQARSVVGKLASEPGPGAPGAEAGAARGLR
eukprot:4598839-Pleurochrysis_carterae.AAC.1